MPEIKASDGKNSEKIFKLIVAFSGESGKSCSLSWRAQQ